MSALLEPGARLERLWTGAVWSEGPVWLPSERALRWSDVVGARVLQWSADTRAVTVHDERSEWANGRTLDRDGRVLQCSHGRRRVEREIDGVQTVVVDRFAGRRFNSPNDVVVAADGAIWFTDPPYGLLPDGREGRPGESEYGGCFVFRFEEATGELTPVITDMVHPNGLAFSPDRCLLYVSDTGFLRPEGGPREIRVYDVVEGGCADGRVFGDPDPADGLRVDVEGRVWSSSRTGVVVLSPDGAEAGRIEVPEPVANLCFGGADGRDLFITATTSLYRIRTATRGAA